MRTVTEFRDDLAAIEKRRKDKQHRDREARRDDHELTPAHVAARAELDAAAAERAGAARKAYQDRGITAGPGTCREPGQIEPEDFRRPYLDAGHASPSPMYQGPNTAPLPQGQRGVLTPVSLPGSPRVTGTGPGADALRAHRARVTPSTGPRAS